MLFRKAILRAVFATLATTLPTIDYPLNSQVPSISRLSEPYLYIFPASTFSSSFPITYTLSGPSWLSLDSATRTLSGTPSTKDVGQDTVTSVPIRLTATDTTGSTTLNATIVVSKDISPKVNIPPSTQLATFGDFSAPSTLVYHPSTPFKFTFDPKTFTLDGNASALNYYAVTDDHTPLPSWIVFNSGSLTFSGQTPDYASLIQPPQTFGMKLIATDIQEFEGASVDFKIEVGVHQLYFSKPSISINATAGNEIKLDLQGNLQLDGQTANASAITSFTVNTPSWLVFNNSTFVLLGTPPIDATGENLTVTATDTYGDTANATITVRIPTTIFRKKIPTLNGTIGSSFNYNMSAYFSDPSDLEVSMKSTPTELWLWLDSKTLVFSGQIPDSVKPLDVNITLSAVSKSSDSSDSQTFGFMVGLPDKSKTASTTSTKAASPSNHASTSTPNSEGVTGSHKPSTRAILAVVLPIMFVVLALLLVLFCYRKRHSDANKRPRSLSKSEITLPVESHSSVEEIVLPPPVAKPKPLQLSTSTFDNTLTHGLTTNERRISHPYPFKSLPPQDRRMRRSQTISGDGVERRSQVFLDGTSQMTLASNTAPPGARVRSYSENEVSKTSKDSSWRSTQSSHGNLDMRSSLTLSSHGLARTYSNYSRKGHTRRSARILDAKTVSDLGDMPNVIAIPNSSSPPPPPPPRRSEPSILRLNDSNFSLTPLDNFSALNKSPIIERPDVEYIPDGIPEGIHNRPRARRQSRVPPGFEVRRRSGVSRGLRGSISSLSIKSGKRRSITHGQDWSTGSANFSRRALSNNMKRNSRTWRTVAESSVPSGRPQSSISAPSTYSETYPAAEIAPLKMTVRAVTKSPSITSPLSNQSRNSRPVSRRIGASPFFGGGWAPNPRESIRKRPSYADSPTVPEEENGVFVPSNGMHCYLDDGVPRDSFGISYGLAREGTRQLRSYIAGQAKRSKTSDSMNSPDFRFKSAPTSIHEDISLPKHQTYVVHGYEEYESNAAEQYSDGSWETTQFPSPEAEQEELDERPLTAREEWNEKPQLVEDGMHAARLRQDDEVEMGRGRKGEPRVRGGVGRRPISVDAKKAALKGSVRGRVEDTDMTLASDSGGSWGAYI